MSEVLNTLNTPQPDNWAAEVAAAAEPAREPEPAPPPADEPAAAAPEETETEAPSGPLSVSDRGKQGETKGETKGESQAEVSVNDGDKQRRFVPLEALQEERGKRKELETKINQLEQWARQQSQQQQPEPQDQPPPIDPNEDPIGALRQLNEQIAALRQEREYAEFTNGIRSQYQAAARSFAAQQPDFKEAYQHTINARSIQLEVDGFAPEQIADIINNEEMNLAARAIQSGRNPAEVIYQYAKSYGYTPKSAERLVQPQAQVTPQQQADLQKARQAAATSLSVAGKPPKPEITPESVLNLRGAALDSAMDKIWSNMEAASGRKSSLFRN